MLHNLSEVVRQFKQQWTSQLDDQAIAEVCREKGMTWRNTLLNPIVTIKLFFLQILHGNTACEHLRHLARMSFTGAGYCLARMRIPLSAFQTLLERTAARTDNQCVLFFFFIEKDSRVRPSVAEVIVLPMLTSFGPGARTC